MIALFAMYLVGVGVGRYIDTRLRTRLGLALQQEALKRIARSADAALYRAH